MGPFFSFIIPTKNRSEILKFAIQSCLNQSFKDFEIIVSDNNSKDKTEEVVKKFTDARIKYVNPKIDLDLAKSFDNGIKYAKGKYVLYLADDEAYISDTLKSLKRIIDDTNAEVISYGRKAHYKHKLEKNYSGANELYVYPFSKKKMWINSKFLLDQLISCKYIYPGISAKKDFLYSLRAYPLTVKCVVKRDLINFIIDKYGYFHHRAIDWFACVLTLFHTKKILLYDRHLNMAGSIPSSTGSTFRNTGEFGSDINKDQFKPNILPVKANLFSNLIYDSIMDAYVKASGDKEFLKKIHNNSYIGSLLRDLYLWKENSINIDESFDEIINYIKNCKNFEEDPFIYYFHKNRKFNKKHIKYLLSKKIKNIFNSLSKSQRFWHKKYLGNEKGFHNIIECIDYYEKIENDLMKNNNLAEQLLKKYYPNAEYLD